MTNILTSFESSKDGLIFFPNKDCANPCYALENSNAMSFTELIEVLRQGA